MKKILLIIFLAGALCHAEAQVRIQKITDNTKSVFLGQQVTDADIYAVFGKPSRENAYQDEAADGYLKSYEYDCLGISTVDGRVYDFAFDDKRYEILINGLYRVKIGDSIYNFIKSIPESDVIKRDFKDEMQLFFKLGRLKIFIDESLILSFDSSGKVTSIRWFSPV